jgi:hypothetical protein
MAGRKRAKYAINSKGKPRYRAFLDPGARLGADQGQDSWVSALILATRQDSRQPTIKDFAGENAIDWTTSLPCLDAIQFLGKGTPTF